MSATKKKVDAEGHFAHTKDADTQRGFDGEMRGPIKLTMLGAGSGFTPRLVSDVVQIKGNDRGEICLVDIDVKRLAAMEKYIAILLAKLGKEKWKVTCTTDRRAVLKGSDYIVSCIEVSGAECVRLDNDIPLEYGIDQCIGDTIGPGGLFKGLRTIPVFLEVLKDAEELCPNALVLNYTNPMNMLCLAAGRASSMQVVGLCHSVQGTSHLLARRAGIEYASWIIEAHQKDVPYRIYGNVMNQKNGAGPLIGNLPHDGCVEVACMIDRNGIHPTAFGNLPPQMAGICRSNMSMFDLAAQAAIEKSKELAAYALMLDPLTAASCSPARIKEMTERLFVAEKAFLKGFK